MERSLNPGLRVQRVSCSSLFSTLLTRWCGFTVNLGGCFLRQLLVAKGLLRTWLRGVLARGKGGLGEAEEGKVGVNGLFRRVPFLLLTLACLLCSVY